MTTYTKTEIALARRGARWLDWIETHIGVWVDRHSQNTMCMGWTGDMLDNPTFFVALLDKCVDSGMQPGIYRRGKVWRAHAECASNHWADHKNRTIAMLLALDAEGRLTKEDA